MRCFGGLVSSRRYRVDQELEIYNFRVVPDLQISKKVDFLMIYIIFVRFFCTIFGIIFGDESSMQIGSGEVGGG